MKNIYVYDIEVAPNYFCAVVSGYNTKQGHVFEISKRCDDSKAIAKFLEQEGDVLIGYNNHTYDDPIFVAASQGQSNRKLYNLSKRLIETEEEKERWSIVRKYKMPLRSIDLIRMLFSKKLRVGLKSLMVTLKWHRIQDLPFAPEDNLPEDMFDTVLDYCGNDVAFTKHLTHTVSDQLNLRVNIEKQFGLDVISKDGVATGVATLLKLYSDLTGKSEQTVKNLKPNHHHDLSLRDCIVPTVEFKSKEFGELLTRYKNQQGTEIKEKVTFNGKTYSYGIGGLHTEDESGLLIPEADEVFIDADVTSFYPSIVIKYGLFPSHLGVEFVEVYQRIFNERVEAKKNGDKVRNETLKLALNGSFGNLRNEYSWLFDKKVFFTITVSGQLLLSMLCEMLELGGFKVISANTDGVTARVNKSRYSEYVSICKAWEKRSMMGLEYTLFNKIVRRDVNCYYNFVCDKKGVSTGEVKEKGGWVREPKIGKGYDKPIIQHALYEYYVNNVPVEVTICDHKDIYDFCMSQRVGRQFYVEYGGEKLPQRINRYYASNKGNQLLKVRKEDTSSKTSLCAGQPVTLFNDYKEREDYDIDYQYYISEVQKIINVVEPPQLTLF